MQETSAEVALVVELTGLDLDLGVVGGEGDVGRV
jgi:hypothetical protein